MGDLSPNSGPTQDLGRSHYSRVDLFLIAAPLGFGILWLPLFEGGLDTRQLLIAQATSFGALVILAVRRKLIWGDQKSRRVLTALCFTAGAAIVSTVFSKDLEASVPLALEWLWLAASGLLAVGVLAHSSGKPLLHTALIGAAIIQAGWGFFVWWGGGERAPSQSGTFYAPNQYAGYLLLLAPLLLAYALTRSNRREALGWAIFTTFAYLSVAFSGSRGGAVAAIVGAGSCLALTIAWKRSSRRETLVRAAVVILLFIAVGFLMTSALFFPSELAGSGSSKGSLTSIAEKGSSSTVSLAMRMRWSEGSLRIGLANPLTGAGLGTFGDLFVQVQDPRWHWSRYAHNQYLEAFAEGGLPLAAGVIALPLLALMGGLKSKGLTSELAAKKAGLAGGLIGGSAHLLIDHDWSYPGYAFAFVVICLLLYEPDGTGPAVSKRPTRGTSAAVATLAIACLAVVGSQTLANNLRSRSGSPESLLRSAHTANRIAPWLTWPLRREAAILSAARPPDLDGAAALLRHASAIDELDSNILWDLANVYEQQRSADPARRTHASAIRVAGNAPASYARAAEFELRDGQPAKAARILDAGIERLNARPNAARLTLPISNLILLRARSEEQLHGGEAALRFVARALRIAPRNYSAWLEEARLKCLNGDHQTALASLGEAERLEAPDQFVSPVKSQIEGGCFRKSITKD